MREDAIKLVIWVRFLRHFRVEAFFKECYKKIIFPWACFCQMKIKNKLVYVYSIIVFQVVVEVDLINELLCKSGGGVAIV